ncbi:MAG: hypothetical protein LBC82_01115 [Oscillospiraceae bacterium]|jgi:hypothetical protein|nr:hypothetical protein [Oscillospiraceae bacterium]
MKKYIKAYKVSVIVFVVGIPTVLGSAVGVGIFIGTTALLISDLIKPRTARAVYYIFTLLISAAFVVAGAVNFAGREVLDETISALSLLTLAGTLFLGIASAFAVRFALWRQTRTHFKKVKTGKSGINL